jgi:membrane fusion protein (multidrug efflux system)
MQKGRQVSFTVDGIDKKFAATIIATESIIEANTRSLRVRAVVKGAQKELVAGGFAKVSLDLGRADESMVIPTQAVIPQARDKKVIVYRSGKPDFTVVSTGIRDSSYVQILDGLKVGDTVITTALLAIRPDSRVSLTEVN